MKNNTTSTGKKYSKIYKVGKQQFRYNYHQSVLEYVTDITEEDEKENEEWRKKFGHNLYDIENGKLVIDRIGLMRENWKESPQYWCERYADDISEECYYLAQEFC